MASASSQSWNLEDLRSRSKEVTGSPDSLTHQPLPLVFTCKLEMVTPPGLVCLTGQCKRTRKRVGRQVALLNSQSAVLSPQTALDQAAC